MTTEKIQGEWTGDSGGIGDSRQGLCPAPPCCPDTAWLHALTHGFKASVPPPLQLQGRIPSGFRHARPSSGSLPPSSERASCPPCTLPAATQNILLPVSNRPRNLVPPDLSSCRNLSGAPETVPKPTACLRRGREAPLRSVFTTGGEWPSFLHFSVH